MKKSTQICLTLLGIGAWVSSIVPAQGGTPGKNGDPLIPTKGIVIDAQPYCLCIQEGTMSIITEEEKNVDITLINNNTGTEESVGLNLLKGENIVLTNIQEGKYSIIINDDTEEIFIPTLSIEN